MLDNGKKKNYGRDKSRTHDLSHAKGTRYQLRHTPILQTSKLHTTRQSKIMKPSLIFS